MTGAPDEQPAENDRSGFLPMDIDRLFRSILILVPLGVLANIALSYYATDRDLLATLDELPRLYLALAAGLALVPWITNALRLVIWTRFFGHRLTATEIARITLSIDLGSAVSPTAVGGGAFKWAMLVERGMTPGTAASVATLAHLEDNLFLLTAVPVALILADADRLPAIGWAMRELPQQLGPILLIGAVTGLVSWVALRFILAGGLGLKIRWRGLRFAASVRQRLRSAWDDAREAFALIARRGKPQFALSMALTAIQWSARYSVISALLAFLGVPIEPFLFFALQWVVFTIISFVPTPGAAGAAEATFSIVYGPLLPPGVLGVATAGWRFLTFYFQVSLASVLFLLLGMRIKNGE